MKFFNFTRNIKNNLPLINLKVIKGSYNFFRIKVDHLSAAGFYNHDLIYTPSNYFVLFYVILGPDGGPNNDFIKEVKNNVK